MSIDLTPQPTGAEFRVGDTTGLQDAPAIAALADGGFVVAWVGSGANPFTRETVLYAQRFGADGTAAGAAFAVNAPTAHHVASPMVAGLDSGGFVVTWADGSPYSSPPGMNVLVRRFDADGSALGAQFRADETSSPHGEPAVAAMPDGGFVLAWGSNILDSDIIARRFAADGSALGAEFRANPSAAGHQHAAAVSAWADGGFVFAWTGPGSLGTDIVAQRYSAGGSAIGVEIHASAAGSNFDRQPQVAALIDGGFVLAWVTGEYRDADAYDVLAQRFAADGSAAGAAFRVNAAGAGVQDHPTVAALADGGFVVGWSGTGADGAEIFARRYAADGSAVGAEFRANGTVAGVQDLPAIAVLPNGKLAMSWYGDTQLGDVVVGKVYAQRFVLPGDGSEHGAAPGGTPQAGTAPDSAVPPSGSTSVIHGTEANDRLAWVPGHYAYEGQGGHDMLDASDRSFRHATVTAEADGSARLSHGSDVAELRGVGEVRFADGRLVFDAADPAAQVARLYEAGLDRAPDQGGLNFWIDAVQHGQALTGLATGFLASGEFQARFGGPGTTNAAFVDQLYQNVLGRAGEAGGRDFWIGSLDRGIGRADVLVAFSDGAENKAGTAALVQGGIWDRSETAAEVARLYDTVLGRAPDTAGLRFWTTALDAGTASLGEMAGSFAGSAEFQAKYGALANRDFANALYVNTLDRPGDKAGLDHWTVVLNAGTARADVVLAFSESPEHVSLTAAVIQSENPAEFGILLA